MIERQVEISTADGRMNTFGGHAEVEIYPGTQHGFAFPQRPMYHKAAAERHWERLFALFEDALK